MARPTKLVDTKLITINIQKTDIQYLKDNRYNRSEFMRQAISALKNKDWDYR